MIGIAIAAQRIRKRHLLIMDSRSFLSRAYPTMKKNNPYTPIMLREAAGTQPKVYARYGEMRPH
jgi:hypothetical protein